MANKGGRPPEKVEDKVSFEQIEKLASRGFTDKEIADIIGVCERTFTNYKQKSPELVAILMGAKARADDKVIESLYNRAIGFKVKETTREAGKLVKTVEKEISGDVKACVFWLNNRRNPEWADKKEVAVSELPTLAETISLDEQMNSTIGEEE